MSFSPQGRLVFYRCYSLLKWNKIRVKSRMKKIKCLTDIDIRLVYSLLPVCKTSYSSRNGWSAMSLKKIKERIKNIFTYLAYSVSNHILIDQSGLGGWWEKYNDVLLYFSRTLSLILILGWNKLDAKFTYSFFFNSILMLNWTNHQMRSLAWQGNGLPTCCRGFQCNYPWCFMILFKAFDNHNNKSVCPSCDCTFL